VLGLGLHYAIAFIWTLVLFVFLLDDRGRENATNLAVMGA
jgi:hypothetical protein